MISKPLQTVKHILVMWPFRHWQGSIRILVHLPLAHVMHQMQVQLDRRSINWIYQLRIRDYQRELYSMCHIIMVLRVEWIATTGVAQTGSPQTISFTSVTFASSSVPGKGSVTAIARNGGQLISQYMRNKVYTY